MDRICDNNDSIDVRNMCSLNDATSYCKKFSFYRYDFNYIVYSFDDWVIVTVDVRY